MIKSKRAARKNGQLSDKERNILEKFYTQGFSAYGSVSNLKKASKLPRKKVEIYLSKTGAHTKYKTPRKRFSRLKVQAFDINEIWSIDVAYMDKLAKYNYGVKYLLVAVDVLSRYLRVEPMKTKSASDTKRAFQHMIHKVSPRKVWSDKGTEFKGEFKRFCESKGIETYSTHSETKSAFAERYIRTLKNIIYKYLEKKWSYHYIKNLREFVDTINSRVNRAIGLAPKKVTQKHVPELISKVADQSFKLSKIPKFKIGDSVRIAKENLPFKKGYKQNYTDEIFQIGKIATRNPPTYNLCDSNQEKLLGKFYQQELVHTRENE